MFQKLTSNTMYAHKLCVVSYTIHETLKETSEKQSETTPWVAQPTMLHRRIVFQIIEAEWRNNASLNYAIIGSDNGLSPNRRLAIIQVNNRIM